jgi:hypothetical protein
MEKLIKNRHFIWIAALVVIAIYNLPSFMRLIPHSETRQHVFVSDKPSPAVAAPTVPAQPTAPPPTQPAPDAPASLSPLAGTWHGTATLPDQGLCGLNFELRTGEKDGQFLGNSSMSCMPLVQRPGHPKINPAIALLKASPTSAILTGTTESGAIQFHVEKVIAERCVPSAFTLTPFGTTRLAAEWKDPVCGNGQMLLQR